MKFRRKIIVGIAGGSDPDPPTKAVEKTKKFAKALSKYRERLVLASGGDGGLMKIACEEFVKNGGETIGFIPLEDEHRRPGEPRYNPYNTIRILSGVTFQARSIMLVRSSDSFVVLGGGAGTIIEAYLAYIYSKPLIILMDTGYPTDNLEKICVEGYLDHRKIVRPVFTSDPEEAAELAYKMSLENIMNP
ncbi:MAG: TIGR00725 family protein [Nitrososphaerota archaeon]